MRYSEPRLRPDAELLEDLRSDEASVVCFALVDAAHFSSPEWVQPLAVDLVRGSDVAVATTALVALGILVRRHELTRTEELVAVLEGALRRPDLMGTAEDVLDDIGSYAPDFGPPVPARPQSVSAALDVTVGQELRRVRRLFFEHHGVRTTATGPVELTFGDGSVFLFDAGPDAGLLDFTSGRWVDPFEDDTPSGLAVVERHGKWEGVDVSDEAPWSSLIGARVESVSHPVPNPAATGESATLVLSGGTIHLEADAEDLRTWVTARQTAP